MFTNISTYTTYLAYQSREQSSPRVPTRTPPHAPHHHLCTPYPTHTTLFGQVPARTPTPTETTANPLYANETHSTYSHSLPQSTSKYPQPDNNF
ncbi:hypothetical protein HanIR_Chr16g0827421 [Helianthus annuus]|nr:hypothetical protein HanIR_Chr16g0827421 [Helianthus annuus]